MILWLLEWATLGAVAGAVVAGVAAGWVLGYLHRDAIEWGRAYGRLARDTRSLLVRGRWT